MHEPNHQLPFPKLIPQSFHLNNRRSVLSIIRPRSSSRRHHGATNSPYIPHAYSESITSALRPPLEFGTRKLTHGVER